MFQLQVVLFTALALLRNPSLSAAKPYFGPESEAAGGTTDHEPKLQIISATQERLEANFFLAPKTGIHILSQMHSNGELAQISITSLDGETIFAVDRPVDSTQSLLTLTGSEFLMVSEAQDSGESKVTEYAIAEPYSPQIKREMKQRLLSQSILQNLDSENVKISGKNAVENLLMHPEAQLIASAAIALGSTGLHGKDNPAAMAFYATALRFSTALGGHDHQDTGEAAHRNKRWSLDATYCSNSDSYCPAGFCPFESNCLGLCGPGCTCWWFICFDCCWNIGCYLHDLYGCTQGADALQCWVEAPTNLMCSE